MHQTAGVIVVSAITTRLRKLEQARKTTEGAPPPVLQFTDKSETGAVYVTTAGFGEENAERVFAALPGEPHSQTLHRAHLMAKRGEGLPFVTSYTP